MNAINVIVISPHDSHQTITRLASRQIIMYNFCRPHAYNGLLFMHIGRYLDKRFNEILGELYAIVKSGDYVWPELRDYFGKKISVLVIIL